MVIRTSVLNTNRSGLPLLENSEEAVIESLKTVVDDLPRVLRQKGRSTVISICL